MGWNRCCFNGIYFYFSVGNKLNQIFLNFRDNSCSQTCLQLAQHTQDFFFCLLAYALMLTVHHLINIGHHLLGCGLESNNGICSILVDRHPNILDATTINRTFFEHIRNELSKPRWNRRIVLTD